MFFVECLPIGYGENFNPLYIPILIRLRDIDNFDNDFDKTLGLGWGEIFVTSDRGWLPMAIVASHLFSMVLTN